MTLCPANSNYEGTNPPSCMGKPRWFCQQALAPNLVKRGSEQVNKQSHGGLGSTTTVVAVIHFDNINANQAALCTQSRQKIVELEKTQASRFESARSRRDGRIHDVHIQRYVNAFTFGDL